MTATSAHPPLPQREKEVRREADRGGFNRLPETWNYAVGVATASSATGSKAASSSSSAGTVIVPSMIACS